MSRRISLFFQESKARRAELWEFPPGNPKELYRTILHLVSYQEAGGAGAHRQGLLHRIPGIG